MKKRAVVLLSGGLDSATVLAVARDEDFAVYAMSFDYGQRHSAEIDAAEHIAANLGVVERRTVTIDLRAWGGSALTDDIAVPLGRDAETMAGEVPVTYVPARNTVFLSFALAWAEVLEASDIFIGVNAVDYSGYPDCRPEYIATFQKMANLATKAGVEGRAVQIRTPLIDMTKAQIITLGTGLGVNYAMTRSCYLLSSSGLACGNCDSCILRRKGFADAGIEDSTEYAV